MMRVGTAAFLNKEKGLIEQSEILSHRATLPCTTGWEWLGELKLGIKKIEAIGKIPTELKKELKIIKEIANSTDPYK